MLFKNIYCNSVGLKTKTDKQAPTHQNFAVPTRPPQTAGGSEVVLPVKGGLSEGSLVLATLQDHVPGVHVESASVLDAEEGLVVVRLNQAVPEPAKVGWLVLD